MSRRIALAAGVHDWCVAATAATEAMARRRYRLDSADYRKAHREGRLDEYVGTTTSGKHIASHTIEVAAVWALTSRISPQFPAQSHFPPPKTLVGPRLDTV
jgi:hypothetical protein